MCSFYSTSQLHLSISYAPRSFTSRLHISVAYLSRISLVWTSQFLLLLAPQGCTSYLHVLCTSAPFRCISLSLDFQSQVLSSRLACASRMASSTQPESWAEQRVAAALRAAVSPTLAVIFLVALPFYMQQFGCSTLSGLLLQSFHFQVWA